MGPIIPAIQKRNYANEFANAISQGLKSYMGHQDLNQENESLKKMGMDLSGISNPQMRQLLVQNLMRGEKSLSPHEKDIQSEENFLADIEKEHLKEFNHEEPETWTDKQLDILRSIEGKTPRAKMLSNRAKNEFERRRLEKDKISKHEKEISPFEGALKTLEEMKQIGKKGNLGIGTSARKLVSKDARKDANKYEQLAKSLIQYASNIPIRNRLEFETLADKIFDPSLSDDSREGIIEAMEMIIKNSMGSVEKPEKINEKKQVRPPLESFLRG